jgi:hypothetical protein
VCVSSVSERSLREYVYSVCLVCGVFVLLNKNVMLYVCRVLINLS